MAAMGGKSRRKWPLILIVVINVVVLAGLLLVFRSAQQTNLSTYGAFAIGIVVPDVALCAYVAKFRKPVSPVKSPAPGELADSLADEVTELWERVAGERRLRPGTEIPLRWKPSSRSVAGPLEAAIGSQQFQPLPGLSSATREQLLGGRIEDLHAIYGGLGSGRLLIIGPPGSGKSGVAILLTLAALKYRQELPGSERARVPVPVMLTVHGWDPEHERFKDWLAERLRQDYPSFQGRSGGEEAAKLVASGKVAVILDGLDEIPAELRPVALRALSEQASFRLVVLGRSDETEAAAQKEFLSTAVALDLQDVDPQAAADYLTLVQRHPAPTGWAGLIGQLRSAPDSPIARALSSPLALTLVRDTYREDDDVRNLLDFAAGGNVSQGEIEDYLLDRVLPAAYRQRPGEKRSYELSAAEPALRLIAQQMNREGTRQLGWWQIPAWTSRAPRYLATALLTGAMFGLLSMAVDTPRQALPGGLVIGLACGLTTLRGHRPRWMMRPLRWRYFFDRQFIWPSLGAGAFGAVVYGLLNGLVSGVMTGLSYGLGGWILSGWNAHRSATRDRDDVPLTPRESWRHDQIYGLIWGLSVASIVAVVGGLWVVIFLRSGVTVRSGMYLNSKGSPETGSGGAINHLVTRYMADLVAYFETRIYGFPNTIHQSEAALLFSVLFLGLFVGIAVMLFISGTWVASCAFAQLALLWGTPVNLIWFLEDARKRDVLRTVGPVYEFRHARLQDRLAGGAVSATAALSAAGEPSSSARAL